jgi:hypothetical protein
VQCNSITAAVTLGYDPSVCSHMCAPSRGVAVLQQRERTALHRSEAAALDAAGRQEHRWAKDLIERGVASDHTLGLRGAPPCTPISSSPPIKIRSVRAPLFPPPGFASRVGLDIHVEKRTDASSMSSAC